MIDKIRNILTHMAIVSLLAGGITAIFDQLMFIYIRNNWASLTARNSSSFWLLRAHSLVERFPAFIAVLGVIALTLVLCLFIYQKASKRNAFIINTAIILSLITVLVASGHIHTLGNGFINGHEWGVLVRHGFFQPQASALFGIVALIFILTALSIFLLPRITNALEVRTTGIANNGGQHA